LLGARTVSNQRCRFGKSSRFCCCRCHVGDRVILARDVSATGEPAVEDAVKPVGLVHVAVDRVADFFGRVDEMVVLPGYRPETADLPKQPFDDSLAPEYVLWQEQTGLLGEIEMPSGRPALTDRLKPQRAPRPSIRNGTLPVMAGNPPAAASQPSGMNGMIVTVVKNVTLEPSAPRITNFLFQRYLPCCRPDDGSAAVDGRRRSARMGFVPPRRR
jgi:hypothetical protein